MALHFDDTAGFYVDEVSDIREEVATIFKKCFESKGELNTEPETPGGQLVDAITAIRAEIDTELLHLCNMFNPETATGIWQDALARIYYIERKQAQATTVVCQCRGLYGTIIPQGSIVQDTSGYNYTNAEEVTIPATGVIDVSFACTETGAINCNANSVTKIITVISGWDSVNNSAAGVTGNDEETQSEFEKRRFETVANNAHGTAYALEGAIKVLDNVQDCIVLDNRASTSATLSGVSVDAHSVAVCIKADTDTSTNTAIAETIFNRLDAGCGTSAGGQSNTVSCSIDGVTYTYNVVRSTDVNVYVEVNINQSPTTEMINEIKQAVVNNWNGNDDDEKVGLGDTIYASRFVNPVLNITKDVVSITIGTSASPTGTSVTFNALQYPVLSLANVTVV